MDFYNKNKNRVQNFWAGNKKWDLEKLDNLLKNKQVYITFDVDGFDASIMPAKEPQNQVDYFGTKF